MDLRVYAHFLGTSRPNAKGSEQADLSLLATLGSGTRLTMDIPSLLVCRPHDVFAITDPRAVGMHFMNSFRC